MFLPNVTGTLPDLSGLFGFEGEVSLSGRSIGDIVLDAVVNEDHTSNLRITENPIESGALIADHAVVEPKEVTISGVMVSYEPNNSGFFSVGGFDLRGGLNFLNSIVPADVRTKTSQTIKLIESELSSFSSFVQDTGLSRALAPWLPDFVTTLFGDDTASNDRVAQTYIDLLSVQKSGETISVSTGMYTYENMLISAIGVSQTKDGSAEFSITVREIFIVDTATVDGVSVPNKNTPAGKKKSGRSGKQSASKTQKGNTQTKSADQSALSKIFGAK